ncbi:MAG: hypothetical protein NBV67_18155 [Tagaea sp.]|nr:hypothetical protein [Tagaea sp.]
MEANGLSGLSAAFYPVLQSSLNKLDQFRQVTQEVNADNAAIVTQGIRSAASDQFDTSSGALTGRGQQLDIQA